MIHVRQPFFSIATATVFGILGLMYGAATAQEKVVSVGAYPLNPGAAWAFTGILFLMAYFALVHLKD